MFKNWYLARMNSELDAMGTRLTEAKARAAPVTEVLRVEHQRLIDVAEGKARDLRLRLGELRTAGKDRYAELKASFEIAREGLALAVRSARRG